METILNSWKENKFKKSQNKFPTKASKFKFNVHKDNLILSSHFQYASSGFTNQHLECSGSAYAQTQVTQHDAVQILQDRAGETDRESRTDTCLRRPCLRRYVRRSQNIHVLQNLFSPALRGRASLRLSIRLAAMFIQIRSAFGPTLSLSSSFLLEVVISFPLRKRNKRSIDWSCPSPLVEF